MWLGKVLLLIVHAGAGFWDLGCIERPTAFLTSSETPQPQQSWGAFLYVVGAPRVPLSASLR